MIPFKIKRYGKCFNFGIRRGSYYPTTARVWERTSPTESAEPSPLGVALRAAGCEELIEVGKSSECHLHYLHVVVPPGILGDWRFEPETGASLVRGA